MPYEYLSAAPALSIKTSEEVASGCNGHQVTATAKAKRALRLLFQSVPYCYSPPPKGKKGLTEYFVTKPWQKSINKGVCQRQNHFVGNLLQVQVWGLEKAGGRRVCKKEVRVPLTRIWWPNHRCPDQDLPKPLFRRKRKRRHQKYIVVS